LINETTGETIVARLKIADGFWSRLVGLQFRRNLPPDAGLLLVPCSSVHTCLVRFPIDAVFLDAHGRVLAVQRHLKPWRLAFGPRKTHAILEMAAGMAAVQTGESLQLKSPEGTVRCHKEVVYLKR
jgi:uncharacterized membrane protein (UPF0127 family)